MDMEGRGVGCVLDSGFYTNHTLERVSKCLPVCSIAWHSCVWSRTSLAKGVASACQGMGYISSPKSLDIKNLIPHISKHSLPHIHNLNIKIERIKSMTARAFKIHHQLLLFTLLALLLSTPS